jgi:hypothetical protein
VSTLPFGFLSIRFDEVGTLSVLVLEGQNLRYCGIGAGYDDVIINGNLDELKVSWGSRRNRNGFAGRPCYSSSRTT